MYRFSKPALAFRAARLGRFSFLPVLLLAPVTAWAQGGPECDVPRHGGVVITMLSNQTRMLNFKSPTIRCPGGVRISADSAVVFESTNYNQLWGNVVFLDEDSRLTADGAQYFSDQRRLTASQNAVLTDLAEGSVIVGDQMVLVRAGPGQPEDLLTVQGRRPHATLYPVRQPVPEAIPPDSAVAVPDPGAVIPDSAEAPPDTTGGERIRAVLPDSAAIQPDSSIIAAGEAPPPAAPLVVGVPPGAEQAAEADRVPYEIDAQRFVLEGTRYFRAGGSVVVTRDSLRAVADSLEYDQEAGALFLSGEARVTTAQTDLAAHVIRLDIPQDEVRGAVATGDAVLEGEDLRLLAPTVKIFFTEGQIERLVAVRDAVADSLWEEMDDQAREQERLRRGAPPLGARELGFVEFPRRPYALAQDFVLQGDSVEVLAPAEILEEVWAMGSARGEATGRDSLNGPDTPPLIARDWLEGNTIAAFFGKRSDTVSTGDEPLLERDRVVSEEDTAQSDYQLKELLALENARSMYRMAASDSTVAAEGNELAIHYVIGEEIRILLNAQGEAEQMEVVGQTRGIHLEPVPRKGQGGVPPVVPDTSGVIGVGAVPGQAGRGEARPVRRVGGSGG